ncbi:hypothetical protein LWF01_02860 [Saxibacter everestensis]|uniref:Uncharacterized protein n=1 Tax=Saxibacter everestensis TaxID=2909229 RepID=A0ABY8QWT8_9MICO|nr:hypothetical protein LWF01_02860 [Brevibacteriaceae bacterium ZFBP1038]
MSETEYRIDFSILSREPGEEDFTEIGFGSTAAESSIGQAAGHMAHGAIQNQEWDEV